MTYGHELRGGGLLEGRGYPREGGKEGKIGTTVVAESIKYLNKIKVGQNLKKKKKEPEICSPDSQLEPKLAIQTGVNFSTEPGGLICKGLLHEKEKPTFGQRHA